MAHWNSKGQVMSRLKTPGGPLVARGTARHFALFTLRPCIEIKVIERSMYPTCVQTIEELGPLATSIVIHGNCTIE